MGFLSLGMNTTSTEASLASGRTAKHRATTSCTGKEPPAALGPARGSQSEPESSIPLEASKPGVDYVVCFTQLLF